jgi:hybrid cluster-associated redox disulfide protein
MRTHPDPAQTIEEVLRARPAAARVFMRRKMACVGCVMAPFETLRDAARIYGIPEAELLAGLARAER